MSARESRRLAQSRRGVAASRWSFFGVLILLPLLVSGCTGGNISSDVAATGTQNPPSAGATPSGPQGSITSAGIPVANWFTAMTSPGALAKYAPYLNGPGRDPKAAAERAAWRERIEGSTAACMANQGFLWVADLPDENPETDSADGPATWASLFLPYLPHDRETVARFGYGVIGTPEEREAAAGVREDPNAAYQATLSPSEAEAYSVALYGDDEDPTRAKDNSCAGKAQKEFPEPEITDRQVNFQKEFGALTLAAQDLIQTNSVDGLGHDDRVTQLDHEWEACFNKEGFELEDPSPLRGPGLAADLALRTRPDGTVGPIRPRQTPLAEVPAEEKSLVGSQPERKIALADFDCRVEVDYLNRLMKIRALIEEEFVLKHQGELDRLVASAPAGR